MSIIQRTNSKNSHYLIQIEDYNPADVVEEKNPGIYLVEKKQNSKTNEVYETETYICTLIQVVEKIKSESAIYYRVEFYDKDKKLTRYIRAGDLFADGYKDSDDFRYLVNNGLIISYKCKPYVIDYLKSAAVLLESKAGTEKTGWNENWDYIGNGVNTSDIIYTGTGGPSFEVKGSREQYITEVRNIFSENPLVFAVASYCASGFILKILRNEMNQILALTGVSSKGKSTVGKLALSLFTHPRYYKPMDATKLGMSIAAHTHRDNFIFFDESQESNLTNEQRLSFIFSLANASERIRAQKQGDQFGIKEQAEQPKYAVLIAGNSSFLSGVKTANTLGAIETRFLEIVLPESIPLWDSIKSAEQAESLNQFILDNHGHLASDYINYIKSHRQDIQLSYEKTLSAIRQELGDSSAVTMRKARILAYTLETAKIIAKLLFSGTPELASEAADNAYLALKAALFINSDDEVIDNYKEQLSHLAQTQSQYFEILHDTELNRKVKVNDYQQVREYNGYIYSTKAHREIAIISTKLSDVCARLGFDEKLFLSYCKENNILKHDVNKLTKKVMVNKVRAHYYVLEIPNVFFEMDKKEFKQYYQENIDDSYTPWN